MKQPVRIAAALAALAAVAAVLVSPLARSQPQITPSFLPIGTSSAGGSSTVWFHDPSSGRVMACQAAPASAGPMIQCNVARLPDRP